MKGGMPARSSGTDTTHGKRNKHGSLQPRSKRDHGKRGHAPNTQRRLSGKAAHGKSACLYIVRRLRMKTAQFIIGFTKEGRRKKKEVRSVSAAPPLRLRPCAAYNICCQLILSVYIRTSSLNGVFIMPLAYVYLYTRGAARTAASVVHMHQPHICGHRRCYHLPPHAR